MSGRRSIRPDEFNHGALPIPAASRIGPFIATGNIFGLDFEKRAHPDSADEQVALMFNHLRAILKSAGASLDDVLKVTVYVRNDGVRKAVDPVWVAAFPDEAARPARQTLVMEAMPGNRLVCCDVLAVAPTA
jgi:enamine deaminase RidA (YjgF/YER057c/UK114 family)